MKSVKIIHPFRFQKLYLKTAAILILSSFLIIGCFFSILQSTITENYKETEYNNLYSFLSQLSNSVEERLSQFHTQADEILSASATSSLMAAPTNDDFKRILEVSSLLTNYVQKNNLITDAWIYLKESNEVMPSGQTLLPLEECPEFPIQCIDKTNQQEEAILFRFDNQYYMASSYPKHNSLGILVARLNRNQLYHLLKDSINSNPNLSAYLYDEYQQPVFPSLFPYPDKEDLMVEDLVFEQGSFQIYNGTKDNLICHYDIDGSNWSWIVSASESILFPSYQTIFLRLLPFLLLIFLVLLTLSLYLLTSIYRPLERIVQNLISPSEKVPLNTSIQEWNFIQQNLEKNKLQNRTMHTMLSEVQPALHNRLFQTLLNSDSLEEKEITNRLRQINSPFSMEGLYMVLAIQATGLHEDLNELEQNIFTLSLRDITEHYWAEKTKGFNIQEDASGILLCTLNFNEETSRSQIKLALADFRDQIQAYTKDFAFRPQIGESGVTNHLLQLHAASTEAQKDLHYRSYFSRETAETSAHPVEESFYSARTHQLLQQAKNGKAASAEEIRTFLTTAISEGDSVANLTGIHQAILEELLPLGGSLEQIPFLSAEYLENPRNFANKERAFGYLTSCIHEAGKLLFTRTQMDRNNYVEQAKRYIAENYADSSLSQESVCSHIGISAPYFSSLFSEQENQNFLDFVHQYRIEQARQLLFATDYTVAEIGYRTGFNSANSFIRVFKKLMGETPGKYRDRIRKSGS